MYNSNVNLNGFLFSYAEIKPWNYKCDEYNRCIRLGVHDDATNDVDQLSLGKCKLVCDPNSVLWPRPREARLGRQVTPIELDSVEFGNKGELRGTFTADLLQRNIGEQVRWLEAKKSAKAPARPAGILLMIKVVLEHDLVEREEPMITKDVDERYKLSIKYDEGQKVVTATISAHDYFGARHGMESLFQLIEFDEIGQTFVIMSDVDITDYPEFVHRGVSLDTSRNFVQVDVINRIIDGLAHSKVSLFLLSL